MTRVVVKRPDPYEPRHRSPDERVRRLGARSSERAGVTRVVVKRLVSWRRDQVLTRRTPSRTPRTSERSSRATHARDSWCPWCVSARSAASLTSCFAWSFWKSSERAAHRYNSVNVVTRPDPHATHTSSLGRARSVPRRYLLVVVQRPDPCCYADAPSLSHHETNLGERDVGDRAHPKAQPASHEVH